MLQAKSRPLAVMVLGALAAMVIARPAIAQTPRGFARWEPAIAAFENQDKAKPPTKNGVVFVGSSTIRFWNLKKFFPEVNAINRGFGGSQLADTVHFLPRLVLKHQPRLVVVYAGDNDLAAGKSPEKVAGDFEQFVSRVRSAPSKTKIVFISIKPSIARWKLYAKVQKANGLIDDCCKKHDICTFVDVAPLILGKDGKPAAGLFRADGLHFNDKGYAVVSKVLEPYLQ